MPQLTRIGASVALTSSPAQPSRDEPRRPPRFLVRVLVASFATVVLVLGAVIALLGYQARQAIGERVREELEAGQRLVAMAQGEQQRNATVQATVLTQSDALAVAFEQSRGGRRLAGDDERMTALEWELRSVEALLDADVVGVTDEHGTVVSATGRAAAAWRGQPLPIDGDEPATFETFVTAHDQPFTLVAGSSPSIGSGWPRQAAAERPVAETTVPCSSVTPTTSASRSASTLRSSHSSAVMRSSSPASRRPPRDCSNATARASVCVRTVACTVALRCCSPCAIATRRWPASSSSRTRSPIA